MSPMLLMCFTYVSYILLHLASLRPTQHTVVTGAPVRFEPITSWCCAKKLSTRPTRTVNSCSRQFNDIFSYANHIEDNSTTMPFAYYQSKLKRYLYHDASQTRLLPAPAPLQITNSQVEYKIEEILDYRNIWRCRQYLLQWKGTPETS